MPSYPAARSSGPQKPPMLDSAHRPVAGPFPQTTKRPVVGPEVPVMGPVIKSRGASGENGSRSSVRVVNKIRAASDAPPRKSRSHCGGIVYTSVLPVDRSILRIGCIYILLPTLSLALVYFGNATIPGALAFM